MAQALIRIFLLHSSLAGLVVFAERLNPIPSRTRPLNFPAPMVLSLKAWKSRSLPGLPRTRSPQHDDKLPNGRQQWRPFCFVCFRDVAPSSRPALSRCGGFFSRFHGRFTKSELLRPFHRRPPLLHSARNARAMHRASRFGAGWSSPVARQAHNLKVVGSNPTPATKSLPAKSRTWWAFS
jgi:hypothetical protein